MHIDPAVTASSSHRVAIDIRRFPWIRRLAADYAYEYGRLLSFFAGHPSEAGAWAGTIARTQAFPRDRNRVAEIVGAQLDRRGAPAPSRAAAARLADPRTVAVVTGQQAGLFGGPLYTLLKAMTAIKQAERVTAEHGVPAVAIFWIESEDHDWQEVSACQVFDAEMQPRTITLGTPPGAGKGPVSSVRLDQSVATAIEGLGAAMPPTEFTQPLLGSLAEAYRPGIGMSEAFGIWLESVLGRLGLVVYDSSEPDAKALVAGIFSRELELPSASTRLASEQGQALLDRGYHAQVVPHQDNVSLFKLDAGRQTLRFRDGAFVVGDSVVVPAPVLVEEARQHPERFSPNVLLRPLVQDTLFPTVCYVAGPNELAYLAQLKPVYDHFGVPEPLMAPRATATLLDSAAAKFLEKYQVPLEALQPDDEAALNALLEQQLPRSVDEAFEQVTGGVDEGMARLIDALPLIDHTLADAAKSSLGRMQHDLRKLHEKIIHAAKRRDETLRRQFARTRAQAFPGGHPQERSIGFVSFLNRYGPALIDRLHDDLALDFGTHWVITV